MLMLLYFRYEDLEDWVPEQKRMIDSLRTNELRTVPFVELEAFSALLKQQARLKHPFSVRKSTFSGVGPFSRPTALDSASLSLSESLSHNLSEDRLPLLSTYILLSPFCLLRHFTLRWWFGMLIRC